MMVAAMSPQSRHSVEARRPLRPPSGYVRYVVVDFDAADHSSRHTAMFPSRLPRGPRGPIITESTVA